MPYVSTSTPYATPEDLANTVAAAALTHPSVSPTAVQSAALLRASTFADGFFRDQFETPLVQWGADVVQAVCDIAAYRLICLRGFNPELDGQFLENYDRAVAWLKYVSEGKAVPDLIGANSGGVGQAAPEAKPTVYTPHRINSTGTATRGTWRR